MLGRTEDALESLNKVYALNCKVFGEEHPKTLETMATLAHIYYTIGNYEKSLEFFERIYALQCRIYGENDHNAVITKKNIDYIKNTFR
jgi:tetratricopeptide (TPR) repeat protein